MTQKNPFLQPEIKKLLGVIFFGTITMYFAITTPSPASFQDYKIYWKEFSIIIISLLLVFLIGIYPIQPDSKNQEESEINDNGGNTNGRRTGRTE